MSSHRNYSYSFPFKLNDWLLCEGNISFKLIKIQFCQAETSVMRVGCGIPTTSEMELFVIIIKGCKRLKIVRKIILDIAGILDPVWTVW